MVLWKRTRDCGRTLGRMVRDLENLYKRGVVLIHPQYNKNARIGFLRQSRNKAHCRISDVELSYKVEECIELEVPEYI
jgi:hypothetical protein